MYKHALMSGWMGSFFLNTREGQGVPGSRFTSERTSKHAQALGVGKRVPDACGAGRKSL